MPAADSGTPLGEVTKILQPPYAIPFPRVWFDVEYLNWWYKDPSLSIPLVTTSDDPLSIGALGEPGTRIIFGAGSGNSPTYRNPSGGRIACGFWFDYRQTMGLDANAFVLERVSSVFTASSAGGDAPLIAIPFNATQPFLFNPAGETSLNAGGFPNRVEVHSSTQLWGGEANGLLNFIGWDLARVILLGGFRYLDLDETLTLTDTFFDTASSATATTAATITVQDQFKTRNQFYGAQAGLKAEWNRGNWFVNGTAKFAYGSNHETMMIAGDTTVVNGAFGAASGVFPGGVFAQPSNIGSFTRSVEAYVPEGQVQIGCLICPYLKPFVGYNFIYISKVIRAGEQLERNINPTQNQFFGGGTLVGPPAPLPTFQPSSFWAHGITAGLEFRY